MGADAPHPPPSPAPEAAPMSEALAAPPSAGPPVRAAEHGPGRGFGFVLGALAACAAVTLALFVVLAGLASAQGRSFGMPPHVGVIRALGPISGAEGGSLLAAAGVNPETLVGSVKDAYESPSCRAVVLRIDSPGGSAAASEEIYAAIRRVKSERADVPLVVSMGDVAASGGFYIACAGDYVFANPSSATGSIGVISDYLFVGDLLAQYGVRSEVIKSGRYKDTGSMFREMREDERELLEAQLMEVYDGFVAAVAEGRGLEESAVRRVADGRVLLGAEALEHGLVDELGGFENAVAYAAAQAGLGSDALVVAYDRGAFSLPGGLAAASGEGLARGAGQYLESQTGVERLSRNLLRAR